MKHVFICICLMATITGYAQKTDSIPGTTAEEFRYFTVGMIEDMKSGRDLKSGYSVKQFISSTYTVSTLKREFTAYAIFKEGENKPRAFFITMRPDIANPTTSFYVIPNFTADPEIWNKSIALQKNVIGNNPDALMCLNYITMQIAAKLLDGGTFE